jgi:hypothetical protein
LKAKDTTSVSTTMVLMRRDRICHAPKGGQELLDGLVFGPKVA